MTIHRYLIALGSNVWGPSGSPRALLRSLVTVPMAGAKVMAFSRIHDSAPLGPSRRRYANAVALIETDLAPPALLAELKNLERSHGRRSGQRWGSRTLDLDIIAWEESIWFTPELAIPHPAFRQRRFVLAPLCEIAPGWRDPVTGLTARHLLARLDRKRPRA